VSTTTRVASMRLASPSRCSTASCSRPQTPVLDQIRNRRWAVDFDTPKQGDSWRQAPAADQHVDDGCEQCLIRFVLRSAALWPHLRRRDQRPRDLQFKLSNRSDVAPFPLHESHADKACDVPRPRRWLWGKCIGVRMSCPVIPGGSPSGVQRGAPQGGDPSSYWARSGDSRRAGRIASHRSARRRWPDHEDGRDRSAAHAG